MKQINAYQDFSPMLCNLIVGDLMQRSKVRMDPKTIELARSLSTFVYGLGTLHLSIEAAENKEQDPSKVCYAPGVTAEQIKQDRLSVVSALVQSSENLTKAIAAVMEEANKELVS